MHDDPPLAEQPRDPSNKTTTNTPNNTSTKPPSPVPWKAPATVPPDGNPDPTRDGTTPVQPTRDRPPPRSPARPAHDGAAETPEQPTPYLPAAVAARADLLLWPGSPGYEEARLPAIRRFRGVRPKAVAPCTSERDVAAVLALGEEVAVRGGGHDFGGRSSTDGILIDTSPMNTITLDGDTAVIGAGARLGEIYAALGEHGRTIPAGCGPTVGIAGLTLGGGLGILGRTHGLTCDSLVGARLVLADGTVVDADGDLLWVLRGGGAPGVVTSLTFTTVAAPFATAFCMTWPWTRAAEVAKAWLAYAPEAPDGVSASLVIAVPADPGRPPEVYAFGAAVGDDVAELRGLAPSIVERFPAPYPEVKAFLADLDLSPELDHSRSEYFRGDLPVDELIATLTADRVPGVGRELDFMPWAGAYNRVPVDATAFPHRDARFLLKQSGDPAWLARSWSLTHPYGTGGVYPNFPEPGLPDDAYYGANTARVRQIRRTYDPEGRFERNRT